MIVNFHGRVETLRLKLVCGLRLKFFGLFVPKLGKDQDRSGWYVQLKVVWQSIPLFGDCVIFVTSFQTGEASETLLVAIQHNLERTDQLGAYAVVLHG